MTNHPPDLYPRLRPIDARPIVHGGVSSYVLRDPLNLAEQAVVVARQLAPALALCNGVTHRAKMRAELAARFGLHVPDDVLDELLAALDEALLLENDRFAAARAAAIAAYRAAPFRPTALAGQAYAADAPGLQKELDGYLAAAGTDTPATLARGLLSPHIDYARGWRTYAQTWRGAEAAARNAELVVLLGTDHYGGELITLTRQSYATPYGILPTDQAAVDLLSAALGEEAAFAGELFHRSEHSLELVAIWLHHMRGGAPVPLVPVLTGSFARFMRGDVAPREDATLNALLNGLRQIIAGRQVLVVASGDLAHVGPAFGGQALRAAEKARLREEDQAALAPVLAGDAEGFYRAVAAIGDRNNVCGLSPLYLALRLLDGARGELLGYEQCPADDRATSLVSVGGVLLA
jgi:hypothetical protein